MLRAAERSGSSGAGWRSPWRLPLAMLRPRSERVAVALAVRRTLRAAGVPRQASGPGARRSRSSRQTLPGGLRDRLLSIPASTPRPPIVATLRRAAGPSWLLASPLSPLVAGFVLALAMSVVWGNPYQAGATTLDRVRDQATPASARILGEASTFAAAAATVSEAAIESLPLHDLRSSRVVTALLGRPPLMRPDSDVPPRGDR